MQRLEMAYWRAPVAPRPVIDATVALLEAALESTHDAILIVDLNRRIIRYNLRYLNVFGFTAEQLETGGVDAIIAGLADQLEDFDRVMAVSRAIWSDPSREVFDTLRFKDGRVFERFIAPHRVGSDVVGLVASFRDVSRAARTEEALAQDRAFLEKAQEVAHVGSWVAELDGSDRIGWSTETHHVFGVPTGSFDGTTAAFLSFVHPDDQPGVQAAILRAASGASAYDIEHRIVRADGGTRWIHARADMVRTADGRAARLIGTVQDITDRRQLEEQLRQSQKLEAIGRLAGGVAHDLNNALTAIGGYAELALTEMAGDHSARLDVEEIRRAAERAASVTRQLLAFSRKQLLEPRVFDVNETIASLARMLERLLGENLQLRTGLSEDVPPIVADPGQFAQAIINLAVNARDAMASGGLLTIATTVEEMDAAFCRAHPPMPPGRYVVVSVADTGHGMALETQARIFEPFFTTKEVGKGTGLGLSMVYGTVKQSGGFIFLDSQVDHGSTFRLFFPPAPEGRVAAAPKAAGAQPSAPDATSTPAAATLLIVEDETAVRNLVASALKSEPYELLLAASAEEAIEIASRHAGSLHLLLTDAIMPGKSGIELANTLVASRPGLPVIVMSGYTDEGLNINGLAHKVVLLHKPFTPRELRQVIRDVLSR
jgi:two-component system, cell cycle sensor histidine kinase and response regulator CckA